MNDSKIIFFVKALCSLILAASFGCGKVEFKSAASKDTLAIDPETGDAVKKKTMSLIQPKEKSQVDILVVVDNSVSMLDEQLKIGQRFGDFVSALNNADWHIGFITSDPRFEINKPGFGGRLLSVNSQNEKFLTPKTAFVQRAFLNTINRRADQEGCDLFGNICPTNKEELLKTSIQATDLKDSYNAGFFRDDAALAIVYLTDEDEMSTGPKEATAPSQVIKALIKNLGARKKFSAYGMIIEPGDNNCLEENGVDGSYGTFVSSLVERTGGLTTSICESDYSSSLRDISQRMRQNLLISSVNLENKPVEGSLTVTFTPSENAVEWELDAQKLNFKVRPAEGTKIDISYQYLDGE